jgi:hypothetical protein
MVEGADQDQINEIAEEMASNIRKHMAGDGAGTVA